MSAERQRPIGRRWLALMVAALVAVGCGGSDAGLDALEAEPMRSFVPAGAELESETSTPGNAAKDTPARISRRFLVDTDALPHAVDSIAEAAIREAWDVGDVEATGGFRASRRTDGRVLRMSVSTSPSSGVVLVDLMTSR